MQLCTRNACSWFPETGTILRGGRWGSTAVWNLLEIHSFCYSDPSLRLVWLLKPSSKCVLVWFFSLQLLKKYTLNPEITLLFINFMLKKPFLKFPKNCNINFWIENDPPPWNFSENSSVSLLSSRRCYYDFISDNCCQTQLKLLIPCYLGQLPARPVWPPTHFGWPRRLGGRH